MFIIIPLTTLLASYVNAQITLTGCLLRDGQEVCLLPGGAETTIANDEVSIPAGSTTPAPTAPATTAATTTASAQTTAVTDCHMHETTQFCVKGNGEEVRVLVTAAGNAPLPTAYTGCHAHDTDMFCMTPDGQEVQVLAEGAEEEEEQGCHFHAGVKHCPGSHGGEAQCGREDRDYNVNLRIGLLFVILATSAIAVYAPLVMKTLLRVNVTGLVFTLIKQFGTGVILATGFVHLLTHAELMFGNQCLGELKYEATATAIAMAGAFLAFLVDYVSHRLAHWRSSQSVVAGAETRDSNPGRPEKINAAKSSYSLAGASHHHHHDNDRVASPTGDATSVLILEAGIIFHSLLLGITLVVAGDSVFITLFIVIIFHQMFEGLALGARIAVIDTSISSKLKRAKFLILPLAFAVVTPLGMGIGIGVLNIFNGNDPKTIVALGTLDSLSAGILLWVGFVDMWAGDWIFGELKNAPLLKTLGGLVSLVAGMVLMAFLGKWA